MDNLKGIAWMVAAMLAFAIEDMFIKLAADDVPAGQIIIVIGLFGGTVFALAARRQGHRILDPALLTVPIISRNVVEMLVTVAFISALTLTPLASLSAIIQSTPLIVTLGAALFLGAQVGWRRWLAIGVGFFGVLMIVRPGAETFDPASLLSVLAAIGLATRDLITRVVPRTIPTTILATWGFFSTAIAGPILMLLAGDAPVVPSLLPSLAVLGAALIALLAYYSITAAMRVGEIAVVTPFRYSRLIFALIFAYWVFSERPDLWTYLGAALVIASGLYTLIREARLARGSAGAFPDGPVAARGEPDTVAMPKDTRT